MARGILLGALLFALNLPSAARADGRVVLVRLPAERGAEMSAALRLELAGRAAVIEGAPLDADGASVSALRDEARAIGATHVVWVVFPGGVLAPAEVRVLDVERAAPAHAMTALAWDVVDPRVVAVLAASLVESAHDEPGRTVIVVRALPQSDSQAAVDPERRAGDETEGAAPPSDPADGPLVLEMPPSRQARRFWLSLGAGMAHSLRDERDRSFVGTTAFYARLSEWASMGVRFRGGGSYSSIEGGIVDVTLGVPSVAVSFREPLGTAAAIELGLHAEGGLALFWRENPPFSDANRLWFGLSAGAFATLELGAANGLQVDYTLEVFAIDGRDPRIIGNLTLSYVHRWD